MAFLTTHRCIVHTFEIAIFFHAFAHCVVYNIWSQAQRKVYTKKVSYIFWIYGWQMQGVIFLLLQNHNLSMLYVNFLNYWKCFNKTFIENTKKSIVSINIYLLNLCNRQHFSDTEYLNKYSFHSECTITLHYTHIYINHWNFCRNMPEYIVLLKKYFLLAIQHNRKV